MEIGGGGVAMKMMLSHILCRAGQPSESSPVTLSEESGSSDMHRCTSPLSASGAQLRASDSCSAVGGQGEKNELPHCPRGTATAPQFHSTDSLQRERETGGAERRGVRKREGEERREERTNDKSAEKDGRQREVRSMCRAEGGEWENRRRQDHVLTERKDKEKRRNKKINKREEEKRKGDIEGKKRAVEMGMRKQVKEDGKKRVVELQGREDRREIAGGKEGEREWGRRAEWERIED